MNKLVEKTISDGRRKRSANLNTTPASLTNQTRVDLIPQQRALALLQYFAYTYKVMIEVIIIKMLQS